jgi:hypothetical protein
MYVYCRYGYLTSTQVKLIAVLNEGETVREAELKGVSKGLSEYRWVGV